jgi:membrane-associated phospholipid phosphatase
MVDAVLQFDAHLFQFINSHHSPFWDFFFICLTQLGNGWVVVPLVAIIIICKTSRRNLIRVLLFALAAGALAGICNTQIKHRVNRTRPVSYFEQRLTDAGRGGTAIEPAYRVHTVGEVFHRNSFPSGHTATAFAAATILAVLYGGYFYLGYVLSLLVAYSRIYLGDHFPLDTGGGALLGIIVAFAVMAYCRRSIARREGSVTHAEQ